jgi:uncharacterized protein YdaT
MTESEDTIRAVREVLRYARAGETCPEGDWHAFLRALKACGAVVAEPGAESLLEKERREHQETADRLFAERDGVIRHRDRLQAECDSLTARAEKAERERDAARASSTTLASEYLKRVTERDELRAKLAEMDALHKRIVTRLADRDELLAQHHHLRMERDEARAERDEAVAKSRKTFDDALQGRDYLRKEMEERIACADRHRRCSERLLEEARAELARLREPLTEDALESLAHEALKEWGQETGGAMEWDRISPSVRKGLRAVVALLARELPRTVVVTSVSREDVKAIDRMIDTAPVKPLAAYPTHDVRLIAEATLRHFGFLEAALGVSAPPKTLDMEAAFDREALEASLASARRYIEARGGDFDAIVSQASENLEAWRSKTYADPIVSVEAKVSLGYVACDMMSEPEIGNWQPTREAALKLLAAADGDIIRVFHITAEPESAPVTARVSFEEDK